MRGGHRARAADDERSDRGLRLAEEATLSARAELTAPTSVAGLADCLRRTLGEPRLALGEPPEPIAGGFDTEIYAFRLRGVAPAFAGPLILRRLGRHHEPGRVLRERAIQNALAELGYPAPRVLLAVTDVSALGGPFLVMERLPGALLPERRPIGMGRVLVDLQLRLHALDPEPLLRALNREGVSREAATFDGTLARLEQRIARASLAGLVPAMRWLREHARRDGGRPVICHGDFHPQNILVAGDAVTGVLDWPNAVVAEPELDVAATSVILRFVPVRLAAFRAPFRWLAAIGQPILAATYLAGYRRRRALDPGRLRYHEVASCLRFLVRIGESRRRGPSADPLDTPRFTARLGAHVARVTGVVAALPPAA